MLEKLISIAIADGAQATAGDIEVDLWTDIPQPQIRLRLWNREGRDPRIPDPVKGEAHRWRLADVQAGSTLTWTVRLASSAPRFELRLQVLQGGMALPQGNFSYSGPLEGLEERSGRFHFQKA